MRFINALSRLIVLFLTINDLPLLLLIFLDCQNNPNIDCRMYNSEVTCDINGKYYPWAKTNCPLYCGYCQGMHIKKKCVN